MRKSPASIATLRSRLRATHLILEELVMIKVAASGIRTSAVLKAIDILEDNASLGIDRITIAPGLSRIRTMSNVSAGQDRTTGLSLADFGVSPSLQHQTGHESNRKVA